MRRIIIWMLYMSLWFIVTPSVWASHKEMQPLAYKQMKSCEVLVCGSDPEGIAAAVSSARSGLRTILIDTRSEPGGLYTSGMLAMLDMNRDESKEDLPIVNHGIFEEMYKHIGRHNAIDIEQAKRYFVELLKQNNVQVIYNISQVHPIVREGVIEEITFNIGTDTILIKPRIVIDAMPDAPVARMAGADYWIGREDLGRKDYAAATLVFSVKGIDWTAIKEHLRNDHNNESYADDYCAWGYAHLLEYESALNPNKYQLRGLNLARQRDDSVVINAFQIFNVNSLDEKNKREAYLEAKKELPYIINYLREYAIGFENATLYRCADELYIREGVRIVGEETLTVEDCFTNRDFVNKIAYGSYPIDLQSTMKDEAGGNGLSGCNIYTIPMGIIMPTKLSNVLVVGRSSSYDSLVHGSSRTVPVGIALGEAAGVISCVALKENVGLKLIYKKPTYYKMVQGELLKRKVSLQAEVPSHNPEVKEWSYPYIQNLRRQGLVSKIYKGKITYACTEKASYSSFGNIVSLIRFHSNLSVEPLGSMPKDHKEDLNPKDVVAIVSHILNQHYENLEELKDKKIIDTKTYNELKSTKIIYNNHVYAIMSGLVDYLHLQNPLPSASDLIHNDIKRV